MQESISNSRIKIELDENGKGGIISFRNMRTGQELASQVTVKGCLFRLSFDDEHYGMSTLSSRDAEKCRFSRLNGNEEETIQMDFVGHAGRDINVHCEVSLRADSELSRWRISIENQTRLRLISIHYPVMLVPTPLNGKNIRQEEYVLVPFLDNGVLYKNPSDTLRLDQLPSIGPWNWYLLYPGMTSAQFMAFYDGMGGIYVATEDSRGFCKKFHPVRRYEGMDMTVVHLIDGAADNHIELPYSTVLGGFEGNWYDAADLYKNWARTQAMCAKRLEQRDDIPEWYKKAPPFIHYRARGKADLAPGLISNPEYHPPSKIPPLVASYGEKLGQSLVAVAFNWEKNGPWYGPDYYPPFGGEEAFRRMAEKLHQRGDHLCMYVQPIWHYRSKHDDFEDRALLESRGSKCVAIDRDGRPFVHMRGESDAATFCLAAMEARKVLTESAIGCVELGADIVQIDSILGFQAHFCFSPDHLHSPGQGEWMFRSISEFLRNLRNKLKAHSSQIVMSTEGAPSELYMTLIDGYDSRRIWFPAVEQNTVPLFSYLYHAYALGFGGEFFPMIESKDALCIKAAQMMIDGLLVNIFLGKDRKMVVTSNHGFDEPPSEQQEALNFISQCVQAQTGYGREYLVFGDMLRPVKVEGISRMRMVARYSHFAEGEEHWIEVPSVMHSSWISTTGRIGHIFANPHPRPCSVSVKLEVGEGERIRSSIRLLSGQSSKILLRGASLPQVIPLVLKGRSVVLLEQYTEEAKK